MPARWSPLKGVTVLAQPPAAAAWGEPNHRPRWYIWTGLVAGLRSASGKGPSSKTTGAGATPGATVKVSMLKRPIKVWLPCPYSLVSMSPWYQDRPNGAVGTWMTKKSNSVLGGKPETSTSMYSTGPTGVIVTVPLAYGAQTAPPAETIMSKVSGDPRVAARDPAQAAAGMVSIAIASRISFFISFTPQVSVSFVLLQTKQLCLLLTVGRCCRKLRPLGWRCCV